VKNYPQDLCGIIEKKIQILQQPPDTSEKCNPEDSRTTRTLKVTSDVLIQILQKVGISTMSDDKAKIARLIGYLTAFSEEKIRQRLSNPEELTSYHKDEVENINKILKELNTNISVVYNNKR
jgi:hypothetical protein